MGTDSRSFIVYLTTNDGDLSIASLTNIPPQRHLHKVSVDTNTPSEVQSVAREESRSGVDSAHEGDIWNSTETFQSVRSRSTSGKLDQVVVGGLVFLAVGLVESRRVARLL